MRLDKVCVVCGKHFSVIAFRREAKYCGWDCLLVGRRRSREARLAAIPERRCEQCGEMFPEGNPYRLAHNGGRFCSRACVDTWQRRHRSTLVCRFCSKEFTRAPSRNAYSSTFCSWGCASADYERRSNSESRRCLRCEENKPASEFWKKGARRGLQTYCKACCLDVQREWVKADPERARAVWRRHNTEKNARRRAAGKIDIHTRRRLYWFQDGMCAYCPSPLGEKYHLDHMHPVSRGGLSDPTNLALACIPCNRHKKARTVEEFLARRVR